MKNIYRAPECNITPISVKDIVTVSDIKFGQIYRFGDFDDGMGMGDGA